MDVPAAMLPSLKCSRCEAYLSRGPTYLQHDGAAVCGCCYAPERPATRMRQYEAVAKLVRFPCRNQDLGCPATVPFVEEGQMIDHEEVCEHRQYVCPLLDSAHCDWLGTRADILQHCSSKHPDLVLQNPTTLHHDITRASTHTYILTAFQVLFLLYTKVCLTSGRIYHSVRHLGTSEEAASYQFGLDIKRNDEQISKMKQVAPQGCLAMQELTLLALNTNSLLDVLGGFDGTTFTVTVKQRISDEFKKLVKAVTCAMCRAVSCGVCGAVMPGLLYRDKDGWRCERCAPARRVCGNQAQGCTHTDIDVKCKKHEVFFCQQRTTCDICSKAVSRGSLSAHYDTAHAPETYRAGSTWRETRTTANGRFFLVSSVAGTAVCRYRLEDSSFALWVRIPVSSERLSEFRCTVRLTHRDTGHTHTYTPEACYTEQYDWSIVVKKEEFNSYSGDFDVCVDITRAETE